MKTLQQLSRQPLKYIAGLTIMSLVVAILSVCLGQSIVASKTQAQIQYQFTTIALPTSKYNFEELYSSDGVFLGTRVYDTLPEEIKEWISSTAQANPDLVEIISAQGLASAFVPELTPENVTGHQYFYPLIGTSESRLPHSQEGTPTYACTMLEIILEEVGMPNELASTGVKEDGTEVYVPVGTTTELVGTVKRVLALQEGYDDPTGRTIHITLETLSKEDVEALNLIPGERYLVYGTDYLDGEWALAGIVSEMLNGRLQKPIALSALDEQNLHYLTETEQQMYIAANPHMADNPPVAKYTYTVVDAEDPLYGQTIFYLGHKDTMKLHNSVAITLRDETLFGTYQYIRYGDGSKGYPTMNWDRIIIDENGNEVQVSQEEYATQYAIPTIAHLEGAVEEFLAAEEGKRWSERLELAKYNYQAFPIIGVEKMGYIADFARETARIIEGRDFTAEELASGAKVCIISESLAATNGLKVGDTISPRFYNYDYNDPNQGFLADGIGLVNPSAYCFTAHTEWAGESEEYIIVGLYRQDNAWCDVSDNLYSFTPNTIFAPKASISSDMDYGAQGLFQTLVLQNGAIEEFRTLVEEAGYPDLFVFYDQEYTTISDSLENYREAAGRAMMIGFVVYGVVLVLFLLFFPGSQGKALATMKALGTQRRYKIAHVFMNSAGILIPGTVIGAALGMLLWHKVIDVIAESVGAAVTLEMDAMSLVLIALSQMVLAFMLTALIAIPLSRNHGLAKRK